MIFLDKFSTDERELLVSLPYRAGLWMIAANKGGSAACSAKESAVLENIVVEKGRGVFESAFVFEVMTAACARHAAWENRAGESRDVPAACREARALIQGRLSPHDLDCYRQVIMNIATAMANSFREDPDGEAAMPLWARLKAAASSLIGTSAEKSGASDDPDAAGQPVMDFAIGAENGSRNELNDFLNTSDDEYIALAQLEHSLSADAPPGEGGNNRQQEV